MEITGREDYDVFVGHPATVEQVRRTIENYLNSAPFDRTPDGTGWAAVGRHAELHVNAHQLDNELHLPGAARTRLRDYPVRVIVRAARVLDDAFEHEATARRVFAVLRAQAWPALLVHRLDTVLDQAPGRDTGCGALFGIA